ncbi:fumarylacetoacetate hydrolase family protein [Actinacidiphila sp. DG2A-62]|uniref:fumarylacetoacetate hydrolase family protein n=1 Tax=Actinacidiphila sp. DG2A-62 TaxID=3108821 RepID=UPI002DBAFE38|nr:fumarylacetoacetate hydrolase family protein [Actinacidiphila sp. DG2A-62]MEC3997079.1 fumarylacetoacetate hydrolase family protein [Actinacidiphila sp. DG2A-62]
MRLVSFNAGRVGRVDGDHVVDLTPLLDCSDGYSSVSSMRRLISQWSQLGHRAGAFDGPRYALNEVTPQAPIPDPSKILAAPVNYADHQAEMKVNAQVSSLGLFLKAPSSVIGPAGTVRLPYFDRRFDQEGELAVVVGQPAFQLQEDPLAAVFGYTGLLDITMRGGEDRSTRKSFATFTPLGPWIVTPDEFGDPDSVDLVCAVNGRIRQQANTRDLIWNVARLVQYASWISPLQPGDIITTGTPAGVDEILDGDDITLELSGLGAPLRVTVVSDGAVRSHTTGSGRGPQPPAGSRTGMRT